VPGDAANARGTPTTGSSSTALPWLRHLLVTHDFQKSCQQVLRNLSRCDWKEVTVKDTMPVPSIGLSRYITLKLLGLLLARNRTKFPNVGAPTRDQLASGQKNDVREVPNLNSREMRTQ